MEASLGRPASPDKEARTAAEVAASLSAVLLAGGRSSRMGTDKASLVLGGQSLLQRAVDVVGLVANEIVVVGAPQRTLPEVTSSRPILRVTDPVEGQGPLAGLIVGLDAASAPVALIVGCDQPFLRPELLRRLAAEARLHPVAIPVLGGRPQPLCCAVQTRVLDELRVAWGRGQRAAMVLADIAGARLVPEGEWREADPEARSFAGVNTPEELERARDLLWMLASEREQASPRGD